MNGSDLQSSRGGQINAAALTLTLLQQQQPRPPITMRQRTRVTCFTTSAFI